MLRSYLESVVIGIRAASYRRQTRPMPAPAIDKFHISALYWNPSLTHERSVGVIPILYINSSHDRNVFNCIH